MKAKRKLTPISLNQLTFKDRFWAPRIATNTDVTIPAEYDHLKKTSRLKSFDPKWKGRRTVSRHRFWDSDVAKWVEAAAYTVAKDPDNPIAKELEHVVDLIIGAQQKDGYLNSYYSFEEPELRWKNIRDNHELYSIGHMTEAAVAYTQATGNTRFLDAVSKCADLVNKTFGRGKGKMRGYPGHQEIELALVRLYQATGEESYLKLSEYFLTERGASPHYYDKEAKKRGEDPEKWFFKTYEYCQAHIPLEEQEEPVGHAVRALYMYAGMADVAAETGNTKMMKQCETLWDRMTQKRMLITGGVGTSPQNEGFTEDYDLPQETAYAETCAAIANVFFSSRMLNITADSKYADVMERALYNGVLSGISIDGKKFFYSNPMASHDPNPGTAEKNEGTWDGLTQHRQEWFGCACCPPNIARLLASLPSYACSQDEKGIWYHLYGESTAKFTVDGVGVKIKQETKYPWDGKIVFTILPQAKKKKFNVNLRIPGWCKNPQVFLKSQRYPVKNNSSKGYVTVTREWKPGDTITLDLPMPVERVYAHPEVRQLNGLVALMRGPIVYCFETEDNGENTLTRLAIPRDAKITTQWKPSWMNGVIALRGHASLITDTYWKEGELYSTETPNTRLTNFLAVPYAVWDNRTPASMRVWMREVETI